MSDQDEQSSSDLDDNYSFGHNVTWERPINNLAVLRSSAFNMTFETYCETSHSEWDFTMSLPEVREDGTCIMSVRLVRTDENHSELTANVRVTFYDLDDNPIFIDEFFTETDMISGDSIEETVQLDPLPGMGNAVHQNARFVVYLDVTFCHSEIELDD